MVTFCIGSTTVASPLERKVGSTVGTNALFAKKRASTLGGERFNIMMKWEGGGLRLDLKLTGV